jgi:Flp pilus assembly protein TadG
MSEPGPSLLHEAAGRARDGAAVRTLRRLFGRLGVDERAVAAVEFALLLPLMLTIYIGSVEVSQALTVDRRVVLLARTLGDLTTQYSSMVAADLTTVVGAGSAVMAPMPISAAKIRITSVAISGSGSADPTVPNKATVCWSFQQNWTALVKGATLTVADLPTALRGDVGTSIVMAEVRYPYTPVIGYIITGTLNLGEKIFMRPRLSTYVTRTDLANNGAPNPITGAGPCT